MVKVDELLERLKSIEVVVMRASSAVMMVCLFIFLFVVKNLCEFLL